MISPSLSLLADLIRRPSVTPAEEGVLDVLEAFLVTLGFTVKRLRFEGDGSYPVDNLFATIKSERPGPHLLFAGHTDVVPPGDSAAWTHDPFSGEIIDGVMWGRGATDMKSGVAAFCGAMAQCISEGLPAGQVSLAITNDEEADAVNGTKKLLEWADAQGHKFDFAIVGEPSSFEIFGDSIKIGRRGSLSGRITVTGKQGHVAYPDRARNPLPVLSELVRVLYEPLDQGTEHFQPSNLEVTSIDTGNPTANLIPAKGEVRFNVRFNDSWTGETLKTEIERRITGLNDTRGCTIEFEVLGPISRCFISPPEGHVAHLCAIMETFNGIAPALSTIGGTSDARFIADYCPVVECGLVGATMHQIDERVPVADVDRLTALYARFITSFLTPADA